MNSTLSSSPIDLLDGSDLLQPAAQLLQSAGAEELLVGTGSFGLVLNAAASNASGGSSLMDLDMTFTLQMLLFMFLVVALKPLLFDPLLKVFEERERRTDGARDEAREMQKQAGELLQRYETEIQRVSEAAARERDRVRAETTKLEEAIIAQARAETAETLEKGRAELATQVQKIRFELGRQSERLARDVAERALGRSLQ